MFLHVRSGWAHYRATTADFFNRRRSIQMPGVCWIDEPNNDGGGGGGGGGDQGGGGTPEEQEAARKAAEDKRLSQEAANWRTKLRQKEQEFTEFKTAAETQIEALKAQMAEIESRGTTPQGDKGDRKGTPDPELVKLQRQIAQLSTDLKTVREERDKERNQLKSEKIQRRVSEITAEGAFLMPKIFGRVLTEKVDVASDGEIILKVRNEAGGIDEVPASLENVMKFRPVDDFESFIKSEGSGGSGGHGGNRQPANDGIDWSKVKGPGRDLDYIAKHMTKINAALAAQGNS